MELASRLDSLTPLVAGHQIGIKRPLKQKETKTLTEKELTKFHPTKLSTKRKTEKKNPFNAYEQKKHGAESHPKRLYSTLPDSLMSIQ